MTIASQTNKVIYTCDGSTVEFPYTFRILEDADIDVILYTIADGTETTLTLTTHYTVSDAGEAAGGNVTTVSTYSSAYKLILRRGLDYTQETDYVANDPFPAESHETALDKLTMLVQQLKEVVDRAIVQDSAQSSTTQFPAASASKVIGWNADGDALENKVASSAISVGTSGQVIVSNGTALVPSSAINGVTVGATTPAAGSFTTINGTGAADISSGGLTLTLGADSAATTRTDETSKIARISIPHYTNAQEPTALIYANSIAASANINIGGGNDQMNAATAIAFHTAADTTTVTGTKQLEIDSVGTATFTGGIKFPTSDPGVAGAWWDNAGTLTKSVG